MLNLSLFRAPALLKPGYNGVKGASIKLRAGGESRTLWCAAVPAGSSCLLATAPSITHTGVLLWYNLLFRTYPLSFYLSGCWLCYKKREYESLNDSSWIPFMFDVIWFITELLVSLGLRTHFTLALGYSWCSVCGRASPDWATNVRHFWSLYKNRLVLLLKEAFPTFCRVKRN